MRSADEVRSEIERTREELVTGLLSLRGEMKRATDWHTYFDRRPFGWLGVALLVGFVAAFRPGASTRPFVPMRSRPGSRRRRAT